MSVRVRGCIAWCERSEDVGEMSVSEEMSMETCWGRQM